LIQGFVSVRIGILESRSNRDLGIAGIIGAVLVSRGATGAFAVGIILTLLVYGREFFRGENDRIFTKDLDEKQGRDRRGKQPINDRSVKAGGRMPAKTRIQETGCKRE